MKYLFTLIVMNLVACQTGQVINNAKPKVGNGETLSDPTIPTDISVWTWLPWYILVVIVLVIITIKTWRNR